MKTIHHQMDATYGTRRMQIELNEMGYKIGRFKVRRMMEQLNLLAKRPKQHHYPIGGQPTAVASNSQKRQFNPEQTN
ncbi:MAG: IS3 family transposase, partial [Gammaproteobacteria bacterium]